MWRITLKNHRQTGRLQNRPVFFWGARGRESGIWNLEYFEAMALRFCVVARKRGQQAGRLTCNLQHGTARLRFLHSDAIAQAGTSYEGD